MTKDIIEVASNRRTASIVALNAVSTLAQIGQFGLATTLLPIALEAKQATPDFIGTTSSAFWVGMFFGLLVAGKLTRQFGYRNTVIIGLVISAISFVLMPVMNWHWWALPAAAIGFGMGLRWIANETWLYRLAPEHARGRVVGIHETLIGLASIIGPLIIVAVGAAKPSVFWAGAIILVLAIVPLFVAESLPATDKSSVNEQAINRQSNLILWLGFGGLIAGLGGWMENSIVALLPVYTADIGLASTSAAWLFTLFGVGAMLCQFPIGWLADNKGVLWTAKLCAAIGAIAAAVAFAANLTALAIAIFLFGGITAGLLTLGMIWAAQHGTGAALTNKVRQVSIVYTCLSAAGPFVAGFVVSHTSSQSLFWQQLAVILVLAIVLIKHKE
jgi:MFS family permease